MAQRFGTFGSYVDRCQSYIERRFLVALLFSEQFSFEPLTEGGTAAGIAVDAHGVVLGQQVPVSSYRLDFAFKRRGHAIRLAIELDGHQFHDASPEAAQRDRVRDRILTSFGWRTIRFTGKEVIQDAMGCAQQAHRILMALTENVVESESIARPLAKASGPLQLPLRSTG